jgi:hypothetical protein
MSCEGGGSASHDTLGTGSRRAFASKTCHASLRRRRPLTSVAAVLQEGVAAAASDTKEDAKLPQWRWPGRVKNRAACHGHAWPSWEASDATSATIGVGMATVSRALENTCRVVESKLHELSVGQCRGAFEGVCKC